jgi:hypothetical protein
VATGTGLAAVRGATPPGPPAARSRRPVGAVIRENMLKPGEPAPAFSVKDHLGSEHSLAALRGKTVVLWFFPKADTPG